jgi:radical SAM protein with 4Fe4S-binding SPASM domain
MVLKYKKIYIEITNHCNFTCSFCYQSDRSKHYMTVEEFTYVAKKIRPFTNYIYLHVLGEPLSHPYFEEILNIAHIEDFHVNITTNGSLLEKKQNYLFTHPVRQINISLHDAEENIKPSLWTHYLNTSLNFAKQVAPTTYISFRLWNSSNANSESFNSLCKKLIQQHFGLNTIEFDKLKSGSSIKLSDHIYMQAAPRFDWPNTNGEPTHTTKKCYALRNHIAILSNGSVVPCCLDAEATIHLGNIFEEELADIITKERAVRMKKGFENGQAIENFCKTCGFRLEE